MTPETLADLQFYDTLIQGSIWAVIAGWAILIAFTWFTVEGD